MQVRVDFEQLAANRNIEGGDVRAVERVDEDHRGGSDSGLGGSCAHQHVGIIDIRGTRREVLSDVDGFVVN